MWIDSFNKVQCWDLDFILLKKEVTNELLFEWFNGVFEYVLEEAIMHL